MATVSKSQEFKNYWRDFASQSWEWRWRNLINMVDDPVDDLKHQLHGLRILGWTLYLPSWLMRGSGDPSK